MAVCLLEVVAGIRTWGAHRDGAVLALVLLPVELVFWCGFALPLPPALAVVRTVLIVRDWRLFRPHHMGPQLSEPRAR